MRNTLKTSPGLLLALVFAAAGAAAQAQLDDARIITARAGGVNFVSGRVEYKREGAGAWQALSDKDELESGDAVRTGAGGRVEVLLNPGSYFRAGDGAQFELADASLEDLRVRLTGGSAVVEATGYGGTDLAIAVETPQSLVRIVRSGIYRFDVLPSGVTEVGVQKGRVLVGAGEVLVKGGRLVRVGGAGEPEVAKAKFEKQDRDALDLWSRERGKELAKQNQKITSRQVVTAFSSLDGRFFGRLPGVWYLSARGGSYTFLPFSSIWNSPYGHSYGNRLWTPHGARCHGCPDPRGTQVYTGAGQGAASSAPGGGSGGMGGGAASPQPVRSAPSPARDFPRTTQPTHRGREMP